MTRETWKATPFDGEEGIEVYGVNGAVLHTSIGHIGLMWEPLDFNSVRIVRRDNRVVVGYYDYERDTIDPSEDNDGFGHLYTYESNRRDFHLALGLNSDSSPEYYDYADEAWGEAVRRTIENALREQQSDPQLRVTSITTTAYHSAKGVAHVRLGSGRRTTRAYSIDRWSFNGVEDSGVEIRTKLYRVMNSGPIEFELWQKDRLSGELGERWAVVLRTYGEYNWAVAKPWKDMDERDYGLARYNGVWCPSKELVQDIESHATDEDRWKRAVELAEQACEIYSDWVNGNIYFACAELCTRTKGPDEFSPEEDIWMSDGIHESCGNVYGTDEHLMQIIQECMDEALDRIGDSTCTSIV